MSSDCQLFVHTASEVRSILEDEAASVSKESDHYWILTAALKRYIDNEGKGQLPIEVCMPPILCNPPCYVLGCLQGWSEGCFVPSVLHTLCVV